MLIKNIGFSSLPHNRLGFFLEEKQQRPPKETKVPMKALVEITRKTSPHWSFLLSRSLWNNNVSRALWK